MIFLNFSHFILHFLTLRLRRQKRIAKAIERRAKKLQAKGIEVDLEALKADYIAQHRGQHLNSSDSEEEDDPIDVVGGTDDCSNSQQQLDDFNSNFRNGNSTKTNTFSIERILCKNL